MNSLMRNPNPCVKLAIDDLANQWPLDLRHKKMAALLHPASVGADGLHTLEKLKALDGKLFELKALFGPQHGIYGETQDNMIEWEGFIHPEWKVPVFSLYGEHREPTEAMFESFEVLLVDLQDVGARYYTFIWTLYLCMKVAEKTGRTVVVHDRPNPIGCAVAGPLLDPEFYSFVGLHSIPIRHGLTIGEIALKFKREVFSSVDLRILSMEGYDPRMWFDQTGLPWIYPSPNMPTLDTAVVYPGMCLFEATNVSEGRGTTRPFELFGAPFIDGQKLCAYMNAKNLPGVFFRPVWIQPTFHKWAGQACQGAQIHVTDRDIFDSIEMALILLAYLYQSYPNDFKWRIEPYEYVYDKLAIDILLGSTHLRREQIENRKL